MNIVKTEFESLKLERSREKREAGIDMQSQQSTLSDGGGKSKWGLTLHTGLGGGGVGMLGTEGGRDNRPHVTDHLLGLDGNLLVTEQVGLHLTWVLKQREEQRIINK